MDIDCLTPYNPIAFNATISNQHDPFALKATQGSDPDTLSWDGAMAAPDHEEWIAAALSEVCILEKNETWVKVLLSNAKTKILPGAWVFCHKRTPDGIVKRHNIAAAVTLRKAFLI